MSDKDKVKTTFTAANGFAMPTTVKANEKTEEVHDNCGTPDCCGSCESAQLATKDNDQTYASILYENKDMDEEFTKHCEQFFKGRAM